MTGLLLLVIGLIAYGSLYPFQFDFDRGNPLLILFESWPAHLNRFLLRDIAINVLLYMPLGLAAFLVLARQFSRAAAIALSTLAGMALSGCMEVAQAFEPARFSSLLDILTNTAGTFIGAVTACVFQPQLLRKLRGPSARHAPAAGLLLVCWFAYQLYPFVPVFSRTRLRQALAALTAPAYFTVPEMWVNAAGWLGVGLALEALFPKLRSAWLAMSMLVVPARLLIPGRITRGDEMAGAVLGLLLWAVLGSSLRGRLGFWLMISAIVVKELEPFRFSRIAGSFSWIPFAATFAAERQAAALVLFDKVFYYGSAVWLGSRRGWSYTWAALAVGGLLLILELAQRYVPGRTAEFTDSALTLMTAWILWKLGSSHKKSGRPS